MCVSTCMYIMWRPRPLCSGLGKNSKQVHMLPASCSLYSSGVYRQVGRHAYMMLSDLCWDWDTQKL